MTRSDRLKSIRDILGYSQRQMAKTIDCSLSALQAYESGKSMPGGHVLESLARMGFNVNWLLTGIGPMKLYEEEIKRALCEEAHRDLRNFLRDRFRLSSHFISDIPGVTYEQAEAYMKGNCCLTNEQLINLCYHVKNKYDNDSFVDAITSFNMSSLYKENESKNYLNHKEFDADLVRSAVKAVEEHLAEVKGMLPPEKKADLVSLLCQWYLEKPEEQRIIERSVVARLFRLAA